MDIFFIKRPRIGAFPPQRQRHRHIPLGNRVLRTQHVSDIRIIPDRISGRNPAAQGLRRILFPWSEHDTGQPIRLFIHLGIKLLRPFCGWNPCLRRNPYFPTRMLPVQQFSRPPCTCEQILRPQIPRVSPRNEDMIDVRDFPEHFPAFRLFSSDDF